MRHVKYLFSTLILLLCSVTVSAHDFEVDGIFYNYNYLPYGIRDSTVSVTYNGDYSDEYYGVVNIPSTITYDGTTYTVTSVGENAFSGCKGLSSITLPEGVTSIGDLAFWYCENLTSITLPKSLVSIGERVFEDCKSLASFTLPEGVTNIGDGALGGCSSLTSIAVAEGNTIYDSRNGCNAIIETGSNTLIVGCPTTVIPEGVTSIGYGAFGNYSNLTSINLPEGMKSIGGWAFSNCSNLVSITLPKSLTSIESSAFWACN